jgi:hypothetical protein
MKILIEKLAGIVDDPDACDHVGSLPKLELLEEIDRLLDDEGLLFQHFA